MRKTLLIVAATLFVAARASAAELDAAEKKWVQESVENLASKSALVRGSSEKAVAGLGLDALPAVVAASAKLKADADWQALSRAVAAMGAGAGKALDGLRMSWPKGTEKRFADVLDFIVKADAEAAKAAKDATVALPTSPADIDARVRQILDGYKGKNEYTSDDSNVRSIVAMGHDAVGTLLAYLKDDSGDHENWAGITAAKDALSSLAEPGDVPAIAALLRAGKTTVAAALANIDAPEALDALVDAINRTFVDTNLMHALERRSREPKIIKALCAWLKKPVAAEKQYEVGEVAEFLAKAAASDAVAALQPHLARLVQLQPKQRVALALADLGEKSGIAALIDVLTLTEDTGAFRFDYPRHEAGLALNRISGTNLYTGTQKFAAGVPGPNGPPQYDADWAATAKAFRAWWTKSKDSLRFDPGTRTWSSK